MHSLIQNYLNLSSSDEVSTFDELPLWSAPFGLKLLDMIEYKPDIKGLDIGCGTGFPLIELAGRLGANSSFVGLDTWEKALERVRIKLELQNIKNIKLIEASALEIPYSDNYFDLVVSNNGINNVPSIEKAVIEIYRVCKPNAQFIFTVNLPSTFFEFYDLYFDILKKRGLYKEIQLLQNHICEKRKSTEELSKILMNTGFKIKNIEEDSFCMKFIDFDAVMNHYFVKIAFQPNWFSILPSDCRLIIIDELYSEFKTITNSIGYINLSVPYVCISAVK